VDFYDHLQRLDLAFFADTKMGEFMQRLGQDVYHIYRMIFNGLVVTVSNIMIVIALFTYGFYLSPLLSLLILTIVPLYIVSQRYAGKLTRIATESMVCDWSEVASFQSEKLGGIRLVKELAAESAMRDKYDRLNVAAGKAFRNLELAGNLGQILSNLTVFIGPMLVIVLGGYLNIKGLLSLGSLLAFFYFSGRMFAPISQIVNQYLALQRAKVGVRRIYEYLNRQPTIQEPQQPKKLPYGSLSVEFDSVEFSYADGRSVFSSLSLVVRPGESVGIVGASGAGKSTITNLIYRFWETKSGIVRVGGENVRNVSLKELRSRLGIVSQETVLFHDSIIENLRIANPAATLEEIQNACDTAGIIEFIQNLPDGFDTVVGEKGVKLSGGQRQRLSIARAVLRDPDILLLDEATSHLDSETERAVQNALNRVACDRTTIVIAHRLSTLTSCDRLVVVENGVIVEEGSHTGLLSKGGTYHKLWMLQT
jgi:ABC-type multidrug transport system fused ATPase/permease subunit